MEDKINNSKTCVRCANVPSELLEKSAARKHFRKFGVIVRMILKPKGKSIFVEYTREESAERALIQGGQYKGQIFTIVRSAHLPKIKKSKHLLLSEDQEIKAELEAMGGLVYEIQPKEVKRVSPNMLPKTPKSTIAKTIWNTKQAKSVKVNVDKPISLPTEELNLLEILKQPAFTIEEKLHVLEARDKLIRLCNKKQPNLLKLERTIGTCPDMCPEKERLLREVQHQVSIYEQDPVTRNMNPALTVKQYSRSSADQEASLPHELRPTSVLQLTMQYLMCKIMDLGDNPETNLAEWYHFIWDRTRGIRKDITQQDLSCKGSVELVEQCARFHIHCAARLVAEDPSVFDQKINTENLTKCLQTLKYMYQDLAFKGEECPNEPEFRAYVILLNLNDGGNFMWDVKQLRTHIRQSSQVKFAFNVYSALDKNNFVKFFLLVRSTTYLNACILLRYFVQVRFTALNILLRSSSPRGKDSQYPLNDLMEILGFEGMASTIDFVEYHGLSVTEKDVTFRLAAFITPDIPYASDRAVKLIESKRTCSVGEVVNGKPLTTAAIDNYSPSSSFNSDGLLNVHEFLKDADLEMIQKKIPKATSQVETEEKTTLNLTTKTKEAPPFKFKYSTKSRSNSPLNYNTVDKPNVEIETFKKAGIFGKEKNASAFSQIDRINQTTNVEYNKMNTFNTTVSDDETIQKGIFDEKPDIIENTSTCTVFSEHSIPTNKTKNDITMSKVTFTEENVTKQVNVSNEISVFGKHNKKPAVLKVQEEGDNSDTLHNTTKSGGFFFYFEDKPKQDTTSNKPNSKLIREESTFWDKKPSFQTSCCVVQNPKIEKKITEQKLDWNTNDHSLTQELHVQDVTSKLKQREDDETRPKIQQVLQIKSVSDQQKQQGTEKKLREENELRRRKIEERKRAEMLQRKEKEIEATVKTVVHDLVTIVEENYITECKLKQTRANLQEISLRKLLNVWRNKIQMRKRKRKATDLWPIWISSSRVEDQADDLYQTNQIEILFSKKRYKHGQAEVISIPEEKQICKFNFNEMTKKFLKQTSNNLRLQKDLFCKIDISLPDENEMRNGLVQLKNTLTNLFDWNEENTFTSLAQIRYLGYKFTYCIKSHRKFETMDSTNGLIFIGAKLNDLFMERIATNLKEYREVPIVIILADDSYNNDKLHLLDGLTQKKIVLVNLWSQSLLDAINEGMMYICINTPNQSPLRLDMLKAFLFKYLASEIWQRIAAFSKSNRPFKCCLKNPKTVFDLYNEAVDKLQVIALGEKLRHQDFPTVFRKYIGHPEYLPCDYRYFPQFWRNDIYNEDLRRAFESLKLPQFEAEWPPSNVTNLEDIIFSFCQKYFKEPKNKFLCIMSSILKYADPTDKFDAVEVSWVDIIQLLAMEKLKEINFSLHRCWITQTTAFDEMFVVYDDNALQAYLSQPWFYLNNAIIKRDISLTGSEIMQDVENAYDFNNSFIMDEFDLDKIVDHVGAHSVNKQSQLLKMKEDLNDCNKLMADLEQSIEIQKRIGLIVQKRLEMALKCDEALKKCQV